VDGLGNPTKIELTEGQVQDVSMAPQMLSDAKGTTVIADKGYDANSVIDLIESQGSCAVIPPRKHRKVKRPYDRDIYKQRYLVEHLFQKLKRCRRVATRFEKLAVTFLGMVLLACILVWVA
jgi:putative transposase